MAAPSEPANSREGRRAADDGAALARHLGMVIAGGSWKGTRLLSEATGIELRRDQVPELEPGPGSDLWELERDGRTLVGHDGGDDGVATVAFFDSADDFGVVVLANGGWWTIRGDWSMYLIMDHLFRAPRALA